MHLDNHHERITAFCFQTSICHHSSEEVQCIKKSVKITASQDYYITCNFQFL